MGGLTDSGTYTVYVHFDGYPDGRLPVLDAMIKRDGAPKVLATLLMARSGGWSLLNQDQKLDGRNSLGDRGNVVEGYGIKYDDAPDWTPQRFPEEYEVKSDVEYVYLIPEVGPILWAAAKYGVKPDDWDWQKHDVT